MTELRYRNWLAIVPALLGLAVCLWVGWRDFDPTVPQDVVREAIRSAPRTVFQVVVQYLAPIALVGFLVSQLGRGSRLPGNSAS